VNFLVEIQRGYLNEIFHSFVFLAEKIMMLTSKIVGIFGSISNSEAKTPNELELIAQRRNSCSRIDMCGPNIHNDLVTKPLLETTFPPFVILSTRMCNIEKTPRPIKAIHNQL